MNSALYYKPRLIDVVGAHPVGVLTLLLLSLWAARWVLFSGMPVLGEDGGNYLSTMNYVLNNDIAGTGDRRPPMIGFLLVPLVPLFGPITSLKLLSVASSVLLAAPVYLLCRLVSRPWIALFCAVSLINFMYYANVLFWGFLPMLALTVGATAWWVLIGLLEKPSQAKALWLVILLAVVASLNQPASIFVAFVSVLVVAFSWLLLPRTRVSVPYTLASAVGAVILSLPLLPYNYAHVDLGYLSSFTVSLNVNLPSMIMSLVLLPIILYGSYRAGGVVGVLMGVILVCTLLVTKFNTSNVALHSVIGRMHYYYPLASFILIGWSLESLGLQPSFKKFFDSLRRRYYASVFGLTIIVVLAIMHTMQLSIYSETFRTVTDDSLAAVEWVKENTEPEDRLVVFPYTVAWLVEGIANRQTYYPHRLQQSYLEEKGVIDPAWYRQDDNVKALKALGWSYERDLEGIDYVVADRGVVANHPDLPPASAWVDLARYLVWESGVVAVYDVRGAD